MKRDHDPLDDILSRWHSWATHQPAIQAFNRTAMGMEQYRTSRQYDDTNGALDLDIDNARNRQVDFDVRQLPQPHQTCIYVLARNLCTGRAVWFNPRLPADETEREILTIESRNMIQKRLLASGIL